MTEKNIFEIFATDKKAELDGKWHRIGNSEFLLARAGGSNTKFTAAYSSSSRPYERQQRMGTLSEETARAILIEPFVKHCLLDWRTRTINKETGEEHIEARHIVGKDGKPIMFSNATAAKLLNEIPDLLMMLVDASTAFSSYAPTDMEEDLKNL